MGNARAAHRRAVLDPATNHPGDFAMRTIPLPDLIPQGTLAYGNGLLVRFREDNKFWVFNGRWSGMFDGETIYIFEHENYFHAKEPFEQVLELTDEERRQLYFGDDPIVVAPVEEDDEIPF